MSRTPGDRLHRVLRLHRILRLPAVLRLRSTPGRVTTAGILVAAGGLIAGVAGIATASGAGGTHAIRIPVAYACKLPSATYRVSALLAATFPASTAAGTPIQPAAIQLTITLPRSAAAYLRKLGASSVSTSGSLAATATSKGIPVPVTWPIRTAAAAAIPATGTVTLGASGTAPPVAAPAAPSRVTFTTTGLAFTLTLRTTRGGATSPATVAASCTASGGSVRLATVDVTAPGASASASASGSPHPSAAPSSKATGKAAKGHRPRIPKGCGHIKLIGAGTAVCGYIKGYSDVQKLYGAARLGPALVNIDFAYKDKFETGKLVEYSSAVLYDNGKPEFPPFRSTFLGFGFVPVTATLTLLERGPISIVSVSGIVAPPYPITVTATTKVSIHVSDVTVNGVPLPVGPSCRAAYPAKLTLVGHGDNTIPPTGYTVPTGGPLSGTLTIPPFVQCGVTENLDPLLTGSISGPGNFAKMTQGKLCGPAEPQNWTCPPPIPKPIR